MRFVFPVLITQALEQKIKALNHDQSKHKSVSILHASDLVDIQSEILALRDPITDKFFSYDTYSDKDKAKFRNAAKLICRYCAVTIRQRCLELGFDNYDRSIHDLGPQELLTKLQEYKLELLTDQLERLKFSNELRNQSAKIFGFKPHPFSLNQEVVSAIFRADPIIGRESEIMMLTIFTFIQKKVFNYGLNNIREQSSIENDDFFNVASIGYLNATIYWNPKYEVTQKPNRRFKQSGQAHFPAYGWTFAVGQITLLIYSRRMVRFPGHIEEIINRVHRQIRKRKLELMSQNSLLSNNEIELIIAQEMKEDIKTIQDIFAVFVSPNSALSALPSEQKILNLNQKRTDQEDELLDIVEDTQSIPAQAIVDRELMVQDLMSHLNILLPQERVVLLLTFGLPVTPRDWQDSHFKDISGIEWKNIKLRITARNSGGTTLETVAELINLSIERIRSIQAKALRKLRANINTKTKLQSHIRESHIFKSDSDKNNQEGKLYLTQMQNLDKIKYIKLIGNKHGFIPTNLEDTASELDQLRLLNSITIIEAIELFFVKSFYLFEGAQYFRYRFDLPLSQITDCMTDSSNYNPLYPQTPATFKNLVRELSLFINYKMTSLDLTNTQKSNLKLIHNYLIKNPLFLVNLL